MPHMYWPSSQNARRTEHACRTVRQKGKFVFSSIVKSVLNTLFQTALNEEDETVDVEGDSELEDWHESQRRRTNLLVSGVSQNSTVSRTTEIDNDGDVIVDGDEPEESSFGPSQYTEDDVIVKEDKETPEGAQSQVSSIPNTKLMSFDSNFYLWSSFRSCNV